MIAILGATGFVGGALARRFAAEGKPLALFARDTRRLAKAHWPPAVTLCALDTFSADGFDLVINAIGAGDPGRVRDLGTTLFAVSEQWDRRVLDTMGPRTRYVFLSSGAIYGACKQAPDADAMLTLPVNQLGTVAPYTLAKLVAEARHRMMPDRAILDLRVFGFADASINITGAFFLAQLARSIVEGIPFETAPDDFVRDVCGAGELFEIISCWNCAGAPGGPIDVYSAAPCSKHDILDAIRTRFGTTVMVAERDESPTGAKPVYASAARGAQTFGYNPKRTSLEIVLDTLDAVAALAAPPQAMRIAARAHR